MNAYAISQGLAIMIVSIGGVMMLYAFVVTVWTLVVIAINQMFWCTFDLPDYDTPWHAYGAGIALVGCLIGAIGQGLFG